jgi:transcriptional regulator with XRE-family HTH domain
MRERTEFERAIFESGLTRRQIAKDAGINVCVLSMIIKGHRRPRLEQSLRIARVLNQDPEKIGLIGLSSIGGGK